MEMKVTYVHHSCFVVELKEHVLVFDYFPGDSLDSIRFHGCLPDLDPRKHVFFFASHAHKDHFHTEIFSYLRSLPDVTYVLSKDIRLTAALKREAGLTFADKARIKRVGPLTSHEYQDLKVETLRSNEEGVAFVVEVEGLRIFHAGDLSWWNWGEEGELLGEISGRNYKRELRRLKGRHIDLAFIPLDPRLGNGASSGIKYFLRHEICDLVFPMHLWQQYDLITELKRDPEISDLKDKIVEMDRENIVFDIPDER